MPLSSEHYSMMNDLHRDSRINKTSSCDGEESSFLGREGTSVSEDQSSSVLVLKSFVTPSDGGGSSIVETDSREVSTIFQDATSSMSGPSKGVVAGEAQGRIQDATTRVPSLSYEYSASLPSKEVSLISTDSSIDDGVDGPASPAFSLETSTGGANDGLSPASNRNNDNVAALVECPPVHEEDGKLGAKDRESSVTTAESTVATTPSQDSDSDSIREEVEVRWLPDLAAVEHSIRPPTPKRAWGTTPVTPVDRIPYVHGSYASAAPLMMYNKKWMRILRRLMPANHADAMEILREAEEAFSRRSSNDQQMARLMKWAENNPVVAAFGVLNSNSGTESFKRKKTSTKTSNNGDNHIIKGRRRKEPPPSPDSRRTKASPVLEWDIWLDPTLVKRVEKAMDVAQEFQHDESADYQDQIAAEVEVDRQVGRLINRMMLAHGSASHLVSEALGVASQYNFTKLVEQGESQRLYRRKASEKKWKRSGLYFSRNGMDLGGKTWVVREQAQAALMNFDIHRKTVIAGKASAKPAGIFVERWLSLFLRALQMAEDSLPFGRFYLEGDDATPQAEPEADKTLPPMCGMFLCLGIEDPNSAKVDHGKTSMATTASEIKNALGSPLRVILDLKSRRVPARVWARVIDSMRSRGIVVEGLGSFDVDELRAVGGQCASNVTAVRFFHSAGDLQKACHANEVHVGDTVYFNAGSLLWEKPSKISNVVCGAPDISEAIFEEEDDSGVRFEPFAFPRRSSGKTDPQSLECRSTLQDYKDRFRLNIGCYVQEFSISDKNLDAVTRFLNKNKSLYDLGLAWGGLNGQCHEGLSGDGYWNQRYMGRRWDRTAFPTDEMQLLAPEDHPLVQKAVMAGAWGALGTVNNIGEEHAPETQALQIGACALQKTGNPSCGLN